MQTSTSNSERQNLNFSGLSRRFRKYALIFRDPVLFMSLLFSGIFIFVFVIMPIFQTVSGGFFSKDGTWDLTYFARYFDDYYGPSLRRSFLDTMTMGLLTAIFGTIVGFIFAYAAIEAGTRNAAEAMGKLDEFGTIEIGKRADLILLEDNPLEDVSNIQKRAGVMVRGRWMTEAQLQSMLDGLVKSYKPNLVERLWPLSSIALSIYMIVRKARRTAREQ